MKCETCKWVQDSHMSASYAKFVLEGHDCADRKEDKKVTPTPGEELRKESMRRQIIENAVKMLRNTGLTDAEIETRLRSTTTPQFF